MTTIISKSGKGIPLPEKLETAELAVDTTNGNLYTKLDDGSVVHLNDGADGVDLSGYVTEAPKDGTQYARQDGDWSEIVIPDGGAGSSVHIGEAPPADPQEGQQWMEVPVSGDATMWIYDGAKWLQQPGGKDGADGVDGVDGLWTDNGDTSISYNGGNVGIGTDSPASVVTSASTCLVVSADSTNSASTSFQTANAQWEIGSFENAGGNFGVFNNATASFPLTIDTDGATTVRQDLDNPYTGTIDADTNMSGLRIWNNATATDLSSGAWFKTGGHWSGVAGSRNGNGGWGTQLSFYTHGDETDNLTQATERMRIGADGRVDITGSLYVNGSPKIGTVDLIKAFSKLRDAVKDEDTVELLKESITNCIGGLIEEWEAMQSPATQEIES